MTIHLSRASLLALSLTVFLAPVAVAKEGSPQAAPSAPAPTAPAPEVPSAKPPTAGQSAARERQQKCGAEWRALTDAQKVSQGPKWPQFWSKCNKRLKGSDKA